VLDLARGHATVEGEAIGGDVAWRTSSGTLRTAGDALMDFLGDGLVLGYG
jgi:hypothetical protein